MTNDNKICRTCKVVKNVNEFQKRASSNDGLAHDCKDCANEYKRNYDKRYPERAKARKDKWVENHPEERKDAANGWYYRHKDQARSTNLKCKYGITLDDKKCMADEQQYQCAICHTFEPDLQKLHVDHNHTTKQVRSLLCASCNKLLGYIEKYGIDRFLNMYKYLTDWKVKKPKQPITKEQRRFNMLKAFGF
jgi:hypothetical protein